MSNSPLNQHFEEDRQDLSSQRDVIHVHATLRIFHEDLEPHELSARLGVAPSSAHRRGDIGAKGTVCLEGAWLLDSKSLLYLTDPNKHIEFVLDKVAHRTSVLRQLLQNGYYIDVLCMWLTKCASTNHSLNAETIRQLASIGINCSFRTQIVSEEAVATIQSAKIASILPSACEPIGPPSKPTDEWKASASEFPTLYPIKGVLKVERVLDELSTRLQKIQAENREEIKEAVKDAILELNEISDQFEMLIETGEREQLCLFLHEHARAAGLHIGERDDMTEEWRTW